MISESYYKEVRPIRESVPQSERVIRLLRELSWRTCCSAHSPTACKSVSKILSINIDKGVYVPIDNGEKQCIYKWCSIKMGVGKRQIYAGVYNGGHERCWGFRHQRSFWRQMWTSLNAVATKQDWTDRDINDVIRYREWKIYEQHNCSKETIRFGYVNRFENHRLLKMVLQWNPERWRYTGRPRLSCWNGIEDAGHLEIVTKDVATGGGGASPVDSSA